MSVGHKKINKPAPTFIYEAINHNQIKVKGEFTAQNMAMAKVMLRKQGLRIQAIREKPKPLFTVLFNKKIQAWDIAIFTCQLATLSKAGIPLVQSLEIVASTLEHSTMRHMVLALKVHIENGHTFTDALKKYPQYFNDLFSALISSGEQSGTLETMLDRIATYLEKHEQLKRTIQKAIRYPLIIVLVGILVSIILMVKVIPIFQEFFQSFNAQLPSFTQTVIHFSQWIQHYWLTLMSTISISVFILCQMYRHSQTCHYALDHLLLKLPILGDLTYKAIIARYSRTLATTFAAGVPLIDALTATAAATNNAFYQKIVLKMREDVATGQQLQFAMRTAQHFPPMAIQMVAIGEESGMLDAMLEKIANYYEDEVDHTIENLTSIIEPLIMSILGILVGGLVIAMYLPIFQMGTVI